MTDAKKKARADAEAWLTERCLTDRTGVTAEGRHVDSLTALILAREAEVVRDICAWLRAKGTTRLDTFFGWPHLAYAVEREFSPNAATADPRPRCPRCGVVTGGGHVVDGRDVCWDYPDCRPPPQSAQPATPERAAEVGHCDACRWYEPGHCPRCGAARDRKER